MISKRNVVTFGLAKATGIKIHEMTKNDDTNNKNPIIKATFCIILPQAGEKRFLIDTNIIHGPGE